MLKVKNCKYFKHRRDALYLYFRQERRCQNDSAVTGRRAIGRNNLISTLTSSLVLPVRTRRPSARSASTRLRGDQAIPRPSRAIVTSALARCDENAGSGHSSKTLATPAEASIRPKPDSGAYARCFRVSLMPLATAAGAATGIITSAPRMTERNAPVLSFQSAAGW